jgi:hypothetical protein
MPDQPIDLDELDRLHAARNDGFDALNAYDAAIDSNYPSLVAELRRLRETVAKLDKLADGTPAVPNMTVWVLRCSDEWDSDGRIVKDRLRLGVEEFDAYDLTDCYATLKAAAAALAGREGK